MLSLPSCDMCALTYIRYKPTERSICMASASDESNYVTRKWRMLRYFSCSEDSTQPATSTKFHHLSAFWASLQSAAPGLAS